MLLPCKLEIGERKCEFQDTSGHVRDFPEVGIITCKDCRIKVHARDLKDSVNYQSSTMWNSGHSSEVLDLKNRFRTTELERRTKQIVELGKKFGKCKLLDFGCGRGDLMERLKNYFDVEGLEIEESAQEKLKLAGHKYFTTLEEIKRESFDIVLAIHVVEHIYDLPELFLKLREILRKGGLLIIETPNSHDILVEEYNCRPFQEFTYWSHHPILHTNESLERILVNSGFKVNLNSGIQRYGLRNHLHWLVEGQPGGQEKFEILESADLELAYARQLIKTKKMDTIWIVAEKS